MFNPLTPIIAEQHRKTLLGGAAQRKPLLAAGETQPGIRQRLLVTLGSLLVSTGLRLQGHNQTALPAGSETLQRGR